MGCGGSTSAPPPAAAPLTAPPTPPPPSTPPPEKPKYGTYAPFTEFPTVELLRKAQLEYTAANVYHDTGDDGVPLPFPPPSLKAAVFDAKTCRHIDQHARNAPLTMGASSYEELVNYLVQPAHNDVQKVRAFFVWIANQGIQRLEQYSGTVGALPPASSPMFLLFCIIFQRKAGGYSRLLANMCSAAGIPCRQVMNVAVKGVGYTLGERVPDCLNSYCVVFVHGTWRLVDQHWGSQAVINRVDDDWMLVAGRQRQGRQRYEQLVYQCDDFYFLTDPEQFAFSHWPSDPQFQLLARPLDRDEFDQLAYLRQSFFELGFTIVNQHKCRVDASSGAVVIELGVPSGSASDCELDFSLYKSALDKDNNEHNKVSCDVDNKQPPVSVSRFVLQEYVRQRTAYRFTVNLPKYGKHKIELLARPPGYSSYVELAQYLLLSDAPRYFDFEPFPVRGRVYGPSVEAQGIGLRPATEQDSAVVDVHDGFVELEYVCVERVRLYHRLYRTNNTGAERLLNNYSRQYRVQERILFAVKLPERGQYVYEVRRSDDDGEDAALWTYLLRADVGCADDAPYPRCDAARALDIIGQLDIDDDKPVVVPVSHQKASFDWHEARELIVEMTISRRVQLSVKLTRCSAEDGDQDASDYVHCETTAGQQLHIFAKFAQHGTHKLNIFTATDRQLVYQYIVHVYRTTDRALAFPQKLDQWSGEFRLQEPRDAQLHCGSTVAFRLKVGGVDGVQVVTPSSTVALTRDAEGGNVWAGDVPLADTGPLLVVAQPQNQSADNYLLKYSIVDKNTMDGLEVQLETRVIAAEKWLRRLKERKRDERENANRRRKKKDKKAKELKQYFDKNLTEFEATEAKVDEENRGLASMEKNQFAAGNVDEDVTEDDLHEKKMRELKEAESRVPEWQLVFEKMRPMWLTERVRAAALTRDCEALASAIAEADDSHVEISDELRDELDAAQRLLEILRAERELQQACDLRNVDEISRCLEKIAAGGLQKELSSNVRSARLLLKHLSAISKRSLQPMEPQELLAELRLLHQVAPVVHRLAQALLLLHGHDEDATQEWKQCQALFTSFGRNSLKKRIADFGAHRVDPEIAARAVEIFDDIDTQMTLKEAEKISNSVWTLFVMAKGQIEAVRKNVKNAQPANVERQKELFGHQANGENTDQ